MFDIASSELLVVAIVALLVVGPKDLPKLMRTVGQWVRRARMMTGQIRAGFDQMMQEAEFQEERERIMKMYPNPTPEAPTPEAPIPEATPQAAATPTPQYNEAVQTFSAAGQASGAPEPTASHVVDESAGQAVEDHRSNADQAGAGQVGASEHRS